MLTWVAMICVLRAFLLIILPPKFNSYGQKSSEYKAIIIIIIPNIPLESRILREGDTQSIPVLHSLGKTESEHPDLVFGKPKSEQA